VERLEIIKALEEIDNLPTLPIIMKQIQNLIANPKANLGQIAQVIAKDQAIAARVIRLVNSAFYGLRERVGSIHHAIVVLGLNTIKNLVFGVSIVKTFNDSMKTTFFDREKFWLHTLSCAMGAKLIAQNLNKPEPEDYFLAGLLHDVGLLVIDQYLHLEFMKILRDNQKNRTEYLISEKRILGITHGEVGEFLAQKWKIPEFLSKSIRFHHQPAAMPKDAEPSREKVAIIHLADVKSSKLEAGQFLANYNIQYSQPAYHYLGINEKDVNEIFQTVEKDVHDVAKAWGI